MGHLLMENRNGLIVDALLTHATGTAERDAALAMLDRREQRRRITLAADKAYDVAAFVEALRERRVTTHIARDDHRTKTGKLRRTSIDGRTTRHPGYTASQRIRMRIEESFGWIKTLADLWDRDHLDLIEPAMLVIDADGHGEIAFGAIQVGLDLEYARSIVFFTWAGFDEMDEGNGSGSAELLDEGTLGIEFNYYLGDAAILKAKRAGFSAAC